MDTKQRLIALSKAYTQTLGFNGFSFQTLANDLGIKKASVHHHFSSKETLGLALIKQYFDEFESWVINIENSTPTEKIRSYFLILGRFAKDGCKICPNSVLATDYNTLPKSMRKRLSEFHEFQREWLQKTLHLGQESNEFQHNFDSKNMADLIISSTQGALQLARIRENAVEYKKIADFLFSIIKA